MSWRLGGCGSYALMVSYFLRRANLHLPRDLTTWGIDGEVPVYVFPVSS